MHKDQASIHKRARTDEQKHFRRQQILDSAENLFGEVGYEAFSMANLARATGVVKGTLYLYFKTKEEVFLSLYNQSLVRWSDTFSGKLKAAMTDQVFTAVLYKTAMEDKSFVPLLIRLEHVIEHNVALESLIDSKRLFISRVDHLAELTAPILRLDKEQASEVIKTMGVLLVGATRTDQGPSLHAEDIPSDVQSLIDSFSSDAVFVKNACRIIAGIRAGTT